MTTIKNLILTIAILVFLSCSSTRESEKKLYPIKVFTTLADTSGIPVEIEFVSGPAHNYPLMAIWAEGMDSSFIRTIYVAESIGKGTFDRAQAQAGKWNPGEARRPAALPYWGHKRGIQADDGLYLPTPEDPVPDAVTGATPTGDFILKTRLPQTNGKKMRVLLEINQSWDWNEFWTNNKFPGDKEYMTSSQPAVIYETIVDPGERKNVYTMKPIGHSHHSGADGRLYKNTATLTTALEIIQSIKIRFAD